MTLSLPFRYVVDRRATVSPAAVFFFLVVPLGVSGILGWNGSLTVPSGAIGNLSFPSVNGTLQNASYVGTHQANRFYEVVLSDVLTPTKVLASLGAYLNSTPVGLVRFGGTGDGYDPTTQVNYVAPTTGVGAYVATSQLLWNLTWFKSWCLSTTPHCDWLSYLPGEENDTRAAVHYARWYHQVLGLAPTIWEFGNEPTQWSHYGKNMSNWSTADALQPTSTAYSTMVHNYIHAVAALYPNDQFMGLEAACACNRLMAASTAQVDGARVIGMAYHSYPSSPTSGTVLSAFYALLNSSGSIPFTSARYRTNVLSNCPTCAGLPVELGEYQAGPFSSFSPFIGTYAGAPFYAASIIQAMDANLSAITVYNSNNLFNVSTLQPSFEGLLYQRMLNNMTMGDSYSLTVKGLGVSGVYALLIKNGTREALLVVNTNLLLGLDLHVGTLFPTGVAGETWSWNPVAPAPTQVTLTSLRSAYFIAPQGILLVANY
ncbi:MAG TPA: hypothetical protein VFG07_06760 [Thermoplasmata archaeon]|nr:hypothetical protein [Thermoplasmata archaeon]